RECFSALRTAAADEARDQRGEEQHQENEEQNLRNRCGAGGDSAEAEDRRDDCDDEKNDRVVKHWASFLERCERKLDPRRRPPNEPAPAQGLSSPRDASAAIGRCLFLL